MKLLFLVIVSLLISAFSYIVSSKFFSNKKKKFNWKPLAVSGLVLVFLLSAIGVEIYRGQTREDIQCGQTHAVAYNPPASLETAQDFFAQGNYDYDSGNCGKAVEDYTKSISLDPKNAQAYNNRAYTYMRLRDYKSALPDLEKAISLNPNYVQALMNRGDIHNYYYQIDRPSAISDYRKVISLTGPSNETSVCGHLFLAEHNGWTIGAYLDFFRGLWRSCK